MFVRTIPEWRMYSQVAVLGEFRFPGTYTVRRGEKLSSLIERAGGFTEKAYPRGALFTRESVRELQQRRLMESIERLERDLLARGSASLSAAASPEELKAKEAEILQSKELIAKLKTVQATGRMVLEIGSLEALRNSIYDIELENGDSLFVPENPRSLQALGAVFNQTAFVFDPTKALPDYIEMAGGYTEFADKDRVFVLKVNGSAVQPKESGPLPLFQIDVYDERREAAPRARRQHRGPRKAGPDRLDAGNQGHHPDPLPDRRCRRASWSRCFKGRPS